MTARRRNLPTGGVKEPVRIGAAAGFRFKGIVEGCPATIVSGQLSDFSEDSRSYGSEGIDTRTAERNARKSAPGFQSAGA